MVAKLMALDKINCDIAKQNFNSLFPLRCMSDLFLKSGIFSEKMCELRGAVV